MQRNHDTGQPLQAPDLGRRAFLRGKSPRLNQTAIRPPWSLPFAAFVHACTRCDDCIRACPQHILQRGDGGYPETIFRSGECTFCGECAAVCKAGAFPVAERHPGNAWQLVVSISPACLSLNSVVCRTCGEHCDTRAIRFLLQSGAVAMPNIDAASCTGCGACVGVCPVNAIRVQNKTCQEEMAV